MKCKICGHRANSLPAMNAHYRKAHPNRPKKARKPKLVPIMHGTTQTGSYTEYAYSDAAPFSPQQREKIEQIVREEIIRRMG